MPFSCVQGPKCMQDFAAWGDKNPVKYMWVLVFIFIVPLAPIGAAPLVVGSFVSRNLGVVGLAAFEAIEKTTTWLENLQTSLWYVQMSCVGFYEGKGMKTECGGFVVLSTIWTLVVGFLLAVVCMGCIPSNPPSHTW